MIVQRLAFRRPLPRVLSRPQCRSLRNATPPEPTRLPKGFQEVLQDLKNPEFAGLDTGLKNGAKGNPLDKISLHRLEEIEKAAAFRRTKWLTLGAVVSMIMPWIVIEFWPTTEESVEKIREEKESNHKGEVDRETVLRKRPEHAQVEKLLMDDGLLEKEKASGGRWGRNYTVFPWGKPTDADSPRGATDTFQGKQVIVAAGDKIVATSDPKKTSVTDAETIELVPTGTNYVPYFPRTINLPTGAPKGPEAITGAGPEYTLLGLGIRTVSFLRVQVYVIGLYVRTSDLHTLQNHLINTVNPSASTLIPGEKEDLKKALLDADQSTQIWESILSRKGPEGVDMAIRVVPTRGTDFKHLQDGWMRGVASRTDEVRRKQQALLQQQAIEEKRIALPKPVQESEFEDEQFALAMREFKGLFQGRGKAPKGSVITLTRDRDGVFGAWYQPLTKSKDGERSGEVTKMGQVRDERVGRLVWLLYLGGKNVSSEAARQNIVDGCVGLVERPVGTVEAMVQ